MQFIEWKFFIRFKAWMDYILHNILLVDVGQLEHEQVEEGVGGEGDGLAGGLEYGEDCGGALGVVKDVQVLGRLVGGLRDALVNLAVYHELSRLCGAWGRGGMGSCYRLIQALFSSYV